jgi:hypothetical protein
LRQVVEPIVPPFYSNPRHRMDLYAINKLYPPSLQSEGDKSRNSNADDSWDSPTYTASQTEELQHFLNLMLNKDRLMDSKPYDLATSDDLDRSTLLNANPFAPSRNTTSSQPRITLADQFTWGAVVCAGIFIVVFVCVMAAWWVHKKQQDYVRNRIAQAEARSQSTVGPFCIENSVHGTSSNRSSPTSDMQIQRPPSYFEVIGFFDPPPSYNEVLRGSNIRALEGYDNAAVTIDELPPPFAEEEIKSDKLGNASSEMNPVSNLNICTVIVIPSTTTTTNEGHNVQSA